MRYDSNVGVSKLLSLGFLRVSLRLNRSLKALNNAVETALQGPSAEKPTSVGKKRLRRQTLRLQPLRGGF